jgi:Domain of unknown function (DUF5666)
MRRPGSVVLLAGGLLLLAGCGSSANNRSTAAPAAPSPAATLVVVSTVTPAARFQPPTPVSNPVARVNGSVQGVSGNTVMLSQGSSFMVTPQTVITVRKAGTPSALQVGKTVAITAKPQADGTLLASMVVIFAAGPNGIPLGQRPLEAGNLMTNATIDKVQATGFSATFPGGGAQVTLTPDANISVLGTGTAADITVGAMVTAGVQNGVAQTVSVQ